jgi:hypothetical protein
MLGSPVIIGVVGSHVECLNNLVEQIEKGIDIFLSSIGVLQFHFEIGYEDC